MVGRGGLRVVPVRRMRGREHAHVYVTLSENGKRQKRELGAGDRAAPPAPRGLFCTSPGHAEKYNAGETRRKSGWNLNEVMKQHRNRTEPLSCMLKRAGEGGNRLFSKQTAYGDVFFFFFFPNLKSDVPG